MVGDATGVEVIIVIEAPAKDEVVIATGADRTDELGSVVERVPSVGGAIIASIVFVT